VIINSGEKINKAQLEEKLNDAENWLWDNQEVSVEEVMAKVRSVEAQLNRATTLFLIHTSWL
jgi:hypothetical protein